MRAADKEEVFIAWRTYGYARVSTREQNLGKQLDALVAFGVDEVFADKASGRDFERPEWIRLTAALRAGDVLVVKSIDRLGRGCEEIIEQWSAITKEVRVDVVVLDMPLLDTREDRGGVTGALISDIVLQLLSYVAQVERESIHQRQAEGIAAARARGVRFGRLKKRRPGLCKNTRKDRLAEYIARSVTERCIKVSVSHIGKAAAWGPGGECDGT
ncbi:recombinase family protein [Collinsella ihumii]|uniref:recombinase family protein n=1 Tax=Collinsella ihumii TaxID=1720204 RepID=UPI00082F8E99|nr:recombinase family protein [Collinsella ihumii]